MARTVYIETTIPSAFVSTRSDPGSMYRRETTRNWWTLQLESYDCMTSEAVLAELTAGVFPGKREALDLLEPLPLLKVDGQALGIAEIYVRERVMPSNTAGDALHLALASLAQIDFLLTWNIRHLANPNKMEHITIINRRLGLLAPAIVTPENLWSDSDV